MPISPERMKELDTYYGSQQETPKSIISPERMAELDSYYAQADAAPKKSDTFLGEMGANVGHAISSAKDLLTGNYEDIGRSVPTPKTQALADKLFPKGSEGTLKDAVVNTVNNTRASDWSGALLEKFSSTPEGKALSVIGGIHPLYNAIGTAVNREVNPAITKATGIHPDNLALTEMLAGLFGMKKAGETKDPLVRIAKGAGGKAADVLTPKASEGLADTAKLAKQYGIPLSLDQITGSRALKNVQKVSQELPFSGQAGFRDAQMQAFNKALLGTVGEDGSRITPQVMDRAFTRVGTEFDRLGHGKVFNLSQGFNDAVGAIRTDAQRTGVTKEALNSFDRLVNDIRTNADESGGIKGEALGQLRVNINRLARKSNNADAQELLHDLENAVVDTMTAGDDAAKGALSTAKQQYKNLLVLEPLAQKAKGGNISPSQMQTRVGKIYGRQFTRGKAGQIGDLARVGYELLPELGGSDTVQKAAYLGAGASLANPTAAAATGATILSNRMYQSLFNRNQGLVDKAIGKAPSGSPPAPAAVPPRTEPMRLLPAPASREAVFVGREGGAPRPMTEGEFWNAMLQRRADKTLGLGQDVRGAQQLQAVTNAMPNLAQSEVGRWAAQQGTIPFTPENAARAATGLRQPEYSPAQAGMMISRGKASQAHNALEAKAAAAKQAQMEEMFRSNTATPEKLVAEAVQTFKDAGLPMGQVGEALMQLIKNQEGSVSAERLSALMKASLPYVSVGVGATLEKPKPVAPNAPQPFTPPEPLPEDTKSTPSDDLFQRVIQQESGGKQSAISNKGAIGVAQIMPKTAPEAAKAAGLPFDPVRLRIDAEYNAALGKAYLDKQLNTFGGDEKLALMAYNWGPGNVRLWLKSGAKPERIPAETRNYLNSILGG